MTTKELVLPVGMVLTLLTSAWSVAVNTGKSEQKLEGVQEIRESLKEIKAQLGAQDGHYMDLYKVQADFSARLAVIEKAENDQREVNLRFLAHLESKGAR